jgi:hypothetical protein
MSESIFIPKTENRELKTELIALDKSSAGMVCDDHA